MKFWSKPSAEIVVLSPADILQNSGNDPFTAEISEWVKGALPTLEVEQ